MRESKTASYEYQHAPRLVDAFEMDTRDAVEITEMLIHPCFRQHFVVSVLAFLGTHQRVDLLIHKLQFNGDTCACLVILAFVSALRQLSDNHVSAAHTLDSWVLHSAEATAPDLSQELPSQDRRGSFGLLVLHLLHSYATSSA